MMCILTLIKISHNHLSNKILCNCNINNPIGNIKISKTYPYNNNTINNNNYHICNNNSNNSKIPQFIIKIYNSNIPKLNQINRINNSIKTMQYKISNLIYKVSNSITYNNKQINNIDIRIMIYYE